MKLRLLLACLLASGCDLTPDPDDVAGDEPTEADVDGGVDDEDGSVGVAYAGTGALCVPQVCGIPGQGGNCGLIDDGCGATIWCGPCDCSSSARVCDTEAPVITERIFLVYPAQTFTAETSGLTAGADSVLHILDYDTNQQLAYNDNYAGSVRSRVSYTNDLSYRVVRVIARARSNTTRGSAWLYAGGFWEYVTLGGMERMIYQPRVGETLSAVRLLGDQGSAHVIYRFASGSQSMAARVESGSSDTGAVITMPSSIGTTRYMLGRTAGGGYAPARWIRNPMSTGDSDGDGVSDGLEQSLGTCWAANAFTTGPDGVTFNCLLASDPRDSDGDGLPDPWEVFGRRDVSPHLPLVMYGANPRHKDFFIEVDYAKATPDATPRLTAPSVADAAVQRWADTLVALTPGQIADRAAKLRNPDGKRGIAMHIDIGQNSGLHARSGNWGGSGVVEPLPGENGGWRPAWAWEAKAANLHPSRRGAFTYALAWEAGAGKANGDSFVFQIENGPAIAHEAGHTLALAHSGDPDAQYGANCKPNYVSLMNYAFSGSATFSDGVSGVTLNNASAVEWAVASPATQQSFLQALSATFDYKVDLTYGHVDWNRDGVYAPAGQTVAAYINNKPGGQCEYVNANVTHIAGDTASRGPALVRFYARTYVLYPDTATRWRATSSALYCPEVSEQPCGTFDFAGSFALDSARGLDAVRLTAAGEQMLAVGRGVDDRLRWVLFDFITAGNAPVVAATGELDGLAAGSQPALVKDLDGSALLMFHDGSGALYQRSYDPATRTWGAIANVVDGPGFHLTMNLHGAPGLVVASYPRPGRTPTPLVYMAAADGDDILRFYYRDPDNQDRWTRHDSSIAILVAGRPALAWVPDGRDLAMGGRLHVVVPAANSNTEKRQLLHMRSLVDKSGQVRIGLPASYSNAWLYSYGADLLYDVGFDTNLRAAFTLSSEMGDNARVVRFDPKADGISDFAYGDHDDWSRMAREMCRHLAGDNTTFPLACLP